MKTAFLLGLVCLLCACGSGTGTTSPTSNSASTPAPEKTDGPQTVTVDSPDGVKLVGSLYETGKPMTPALLLLHQWGSDRHSYDDFATKMQAAGFNVLTIDGRGCGESTKKGDGSAVTAGRTDADVKAMLGDVDAAFHYLASQQNVDKNRMGIVGASYGSSLALLWGADHSKGLAVALLSPGLNYFGNMPTEPALEKYGSDCEVFLAAAKDDPESAKAVDVLYNKWNETRSNVQIKRVVKESGGHGTALLKVGLSDDLEKFFKPLLKH